MLWPGNDGQPLDSYRIGRRLVQNRGASWLVIPGRGRYRLSVEHDLHFVERKGGDSPEWPEDLQVRHQDDLHSDGERDGQCRRRRAERE